MISVHSFTFNAFQENTYVLSDESGACIIIDAGCYEKHEQRELQDFIKEKKFSVEKIVNTHCHIDHVLGNYWCKETFKAPIFIPEREVPVLKSIPTYAPMYGFAQYAEAAPDGFLPESGKLTFGNSALDILFVPGHSPGHLAFYAQKAGFCINGDVLFHGSIGRTDLPGGNFDTLMQSIKERMFALPDATVVYCGHGPETTIAFEKKHNPYCKLK